MIERILLPHFLDSVSLKFSLSERDSIKEASRSTLTVKTIRLPQAIESCGFRIFP